MCQVEVWLIFQDSRYNELIWMGREEDHAMACWWPRNCNKHHNNNSNNSTTQCTGGGGTCNSITCGCCRGRRARGACRSWGQIEGHGERTSWRALVSCRFERPNGELLIASRRRFQVRGALAAHNKHGQLRTIRPSQGLTCAPNRRTAYQNTRRHLAGWWRRNAPTAATHFNSTASARSSLSFGGASSESASHFQLHQQQQRRLTSSASSVQSSSLRHQRLNQFQNKGACGRRQASCVTPERDDEQQRAEDNNCGGHELGKPRARRQQRERLTCVSLRRRCSAPIAEENEDDERFCRRHDELAVARAAKTRRQFANCIATCCHWHDSAQCCCWRRASCCTQSSPKTTTTTPSASRLCRRAQPLNIKSVSAAALVTNLNGTRVTRKTLTRGRTFPAIACSGPLASNNNNNNNHSIRSCDAQLKMMDSNDNKHKPRQPQPPSKRPALLDTALVGQLAPSNILPRPPTGPRKVASSGRRTGEAQQQRASEWEQENVHSLELVGQRARMAISIYEPLPRAKQQDQARPCRPDNLLSGEPRRRRTSARQQVTERVAKSPTIPEEELPGELVGVPAQVHTASQSSSSVATSEGLLVATIQAEWGGASKSLVLDARIPFDVLIGDVLAKLVEIELDRQERTSANTSGARKRQERILADQLKLGELEGEARKLALLFRAHLDELGGSGGDEDDDDDDDDTAPVASQQKVDPTAMSSEEQVRLCERPNLVVAAGLQLQRERQRDDKPLMVSRGECCCATRNCCAQVDEQRGRAREAPPKSRRAVDVSRSCSAPPRGSSAANDDDDDDDDEAHACESARPLDELQWGGVDARNSACSNLGHLHAHDGREKGAHCTGGELSVCCASQTATSESESKATTRAQKHEKLTDLQRQQPQQQQSDKDDDAGEAKSRQVEAALSAPPPPPTRSSHCLACAAPRDRNQISANCNECAKHQQQLQFKSSRLADDQLKLVESVPEEASKEQAISSSHVNMAPNARRMTPTDSQTIAPLTSCGTRNAMSYANSVKSMAANKTPPGKQRATNNETNNQNAGQVGARTSDDAGGPEQLASDEQRATESTSWVVLNDQERRRVAGKQSERAADDDESSSAASRALPRGAWSAVVARSAGSSQPVESPHKAVQVDPRPASGRRRREPSGSGRHRPHGGQQQQQRGDGARRVSEHKSAARRRRGGGAVVAGGDGQANESARRPAGRGTPTQAHSARRWQDGQPSGAPVSTARRLGGGHKDSADKDNDNSVSLTQQQQQQQVACAQETQLDDGHSAATSLRCANPNVREVVASEQASGQAAQLAKGDAHTRGKTKSAAVRAAESSTHHSGANRSSQAPPSTPAGGQLRADRLRNKRGGAADAHGRPRDTSVWTVGAVDRAATATACCSNPANNSTGQADRGGARQALATATCGSRPIAGVNSIAHVSEQQTSNCKPDCSESTAARAVAKRCNANDEGGNNNLDIISHGANCGAKTDTMSDTDNNSNNNTTSNHDNIITTADIICNDNSECADQSNITCNPSIATEPPASFTTTTTTSNFPPPPPSQSQEAPSQPSQGQPAPSITVPNATITMQQEVPTSKRPANNRSILILREIAPNAPESSIRDLFNSENCPSKPVHCEYALQNSWYVTFANDEDACLALAHIRKHVVEWNGKPIMARYKPKPAIASAANQPPPHSQHHHHHHSTHSQPQPHPHPHHQHPHHQGHHQHHLMSAYNPYYAAPQGSIALAQWDLSTVFVLNGLSPYSKTSVSGVSLLGNSSDPA